MTEQTLEAPSRPAPVGTPPERSSPGPSLGALAYRFRWPLSAVGMLILGTLVVLWARTRPGYDPYGWLVWGKLTLRAALDTNGAPSWKPLPYLFTVPYALFGRYELWLWMITAVTISLSGIVFAYRIAFWLTEAPAERRYAAYAAGLFSALTLPLMGLHTGILLDTFPHNLLSSQVDTMGVALALAGIDCMLCHRPRWAFWMWVLAALGRPEIWPFLGLYSIWAWRKIPSMRWMIATGLVLQPVLWFGIPAISSRSWFVAGDNALNSPRELHGGKIIGTFRRYFDLQITPVWVAAALATAWAVWRRRWTLILLAVGSLVWLVIEVAFVLHGWPGVPRYLFPAVAIASILGGVFVGRVILDLPPLVAKLSARASPRSLSPRALTNVGSSAVAVVLVLLAVAMVPQAHARYRIDRLDLTHERDRTVFVGHLRTVVSRLGSARILACGQPNIPIEYQSILAWYMNTKTGIYYVFAPYLKLHPHPLVDFIPGHNSWRVKVTRLGPETPAQSADCHQLHLLLRW